MQLGVWVVMTLVGVLALVISGVLRLLGVSPWLMVLAVVLATVVVVVPWWVLRRDSDWTGFSRRLLWKRHEGSHHAFAGVTLHIEDDGRHVWIDGGDLMRVTGQRMPDDALAARHAGHWRRDERGALLLRVDAVVKALVEGRGRDEPRILRLRQYLERDVLFPAEQRRRRAG